MRSLQDEIRQAQQELTCPICNRTFELRDIQLRNYGKSSVELSVTCSRGHFPVILLVPITLKDMVKAGQIGDREMEKAFIKIDRIRESVSELLD